jgi:hypothetical protein
MHNGFIIRRREASWLGKLCNGIDGIDGIDGFLI